MDIEENKEITLLISKIEEQLQSQREAIKDAQSIVGFIELIEENQDVLKNKLRVNLEES